MRVLELKAENFKRLVAVDISPNGDVIQITGKNGAGKSSVLDAIAYAIGGRDLIPAEPVRNGTKEAEVSVDLGDYKVTRRSTLKANYLEVTSKDGAKLGSPQAVLDKLFGTLTFDPLGFARMKAADQRDVLLRLLGIGDKLAKLDADRLAAFNERTIVGRTVKQLEGQLTGLPITTLPPEPKPVADLTAALNAAHAANRANAEVRAATKRAVDAHHSALMATDYQEKKIVEMERQITAERIALENLIRERADRASDVRDAQNKEAKLADVPTADIEKQIADSQSAATAYATALSMSGKRDEVKASLAKANGASDELTAKIEACDNAKDKLIACAEWPIDGLNFSAAGVAYGGVPFEQASSSEQLRVSLAIGMALNPTLRVLLIRDGSLLDSAALGIIGKMASDKGYQVWIERVDESGKIGVVIEDGEVKVDHSENDE